MEEIIRRLRCMTPVIGLDFGDFNSYTSFIQDKDPNTLLGGNPVDLMPPDAQCDGIPSVFCPREDGTFLCGRAAMTGAAPAHRRFCRLKRFLGQPLLLDGKPVTIGGREWTFDDAIREVVQTVVREANEQLSERSLTTTNKISLAYPATYSAAARERLIRIVESATLSDGRRLEVVSTVMEPAAAGLEYLAETNCEEITTMMVADMSSCAFELSLVTCCPKGKTNEYGRLIYYDMHHIDGLPIGGRDFDEVIARLLEQKLDEELRQLGETRADYMTDRIRKTAESVKKELSDPQMERAGLIVYICHADQDVRLEVRRREFEEHPRTKELLAMMVEKIRGMLEDRNIPRPSEIVLTGGACRMPMIRKTLEKEFPAYQNHIHVFETLTAVSRGAARCGTLNPPEKEETQWQ